MKRATSFKAWLGALTCSIALCGESAAAAEGADDADTNAVRYRRHMMDAIDAQFQAITLVVIANAPQENLASHLEAAHAIARTGVSSFEPNVAGGNALPRIWEEWDDFRAQMERFEASIARAAEVARTGTLEDVKPYLDRINCSNCHTAYRRNRTPGVAPYR